MKGIEQKIIKFISACSVLAWLAAFLAVCFMVYDIHHLRPTEVQRDTIRTVIYDTVLVEQPVPRDSVVLRYVTKVLPKKDEASPSVCDTFFHENYAQNTPEIIRDSVSVEIPIVQKVYESKDYKAYVSGYEPNLDSIKLYRSTISEQITIEKIKRPRFGFGLVAGAGYGVIHNKPDIFIGAAAYYRLWP